MLTCQELTELVTEYLEGRMPFFRRLGFRLHLAMCRHCRAHIDQMRKTVETLGRLPPETVSPEAMEALRRRFAGWKNDR